MQSGSGLQAIVCAIACLELAFQCAGLDRPALTAANGYLRMTSSSIVVVVLPRCDVIEFRSPNKFDHKNSPSASHFITEHKAKPALWRPTEFELPRLWAPPLHRPLYPSHRPFFQRPPVSFRAFGPQRFSGRPSEPCVVGGQCPAASQRQTPDPPRPSHPLTASGKARVEHFLPTPSTALLQAAPSSSTRTACRPRPISAPFSPPQGHATLKPSSSSPVPPRACVSKTSVAIPILLTPSTVGETPGDQDVYHLQGTSFPSPSQTAASAMPLDASRAAFNVAAVCIGYAVAAAALRLACDDS